MAFTEDLDVFFADYGVDAIYTPLGGAAKSILVIFDNEFAAAQGLGAIGVDSSVPQALCKTSDVSDATRGATLLVGGITYSVTEPMPDGTGMTTLRLSKD